MDMAEDCLTRNCEQRILRCIRFRLMDDRRDSLPLPYPKTFEWAVEQSDTSLKWDNLADWLEGGTGLYWVCGKGKSTLVMLSFRERSSLTIRSWQWQVNFDEIHLVGGKNYVTSGRLGRLDSSYNGKLLFLVSRHT